MYLLFWSHNDLFQAVKPISNHCGGKHIFTSSQCQRQTEGGVRSRAHWASSSLYLGTFLMKYLSPAVRPVVTVQLFFPRLMFSCCSIQPLSLLAWLPAMPESFQQTPLSASWSDMNKTTSNFETMACFSCHVSLCICEEKNKSASCCCCCVILNRMQIHWNLLEWAEATLFTNHSKILWILMWFNMDRKVCVSPSPSALT